MGYHHHIDRFDHEVLAGWIYLREAPTARVRLALEVDGRIELEFDAANERADLVERKIGSTGRCAFHVDMSKILGSRTHSALNLKLADGGFSIATAGAELVRQTTSKFGGLWVDRSDFSRIAAQKLATGSLSERLFPHVMDFAVKGYTVFPKLISDRVTDKINLDIDELWDEVPGRAKIETWQLENRLQYIPVRRDLKGGHNKLIDVYMFSEAAREAILNPTLCEFFGALFEDDVQVMQSLSFMIGSGQAIHKDTAYVRVEPNLHLSAVWIALEDIAAGTGELEYYVGSHRDDDFLFDGRHKWINSTEADTYLRSLHEDAQKHGHKREKFLARKGDVLIWHADLAHGGSAITDKEKTRRSLVAHYAPKAAKPFLKPMAKLPHGNHLFTSWFYGS